MQMPINMVIKQDINDFIVEYSWEQSKKSENHYQHTGAEQNFN